MTENITTWESLNALEKNMLGDYPNIIALFKATPYRGSDDPAGQKLEAALTKKLSIPGVGETTIGINKEFAGRFEKSLADDTIRAGIAALPAEVMAKNIDQVIQSPENLPAILEKAIKEPSVSPVVAPASVASPESPLKKEFSGAADQKAEKLETITAVSSPASLEQRQADLIASIAKAPDFEKFMGNVAKNPDLQAAMSMAFEGEGGDPEKSMAMLENIEARAKNDPAFFSKLNEKLENSPQMVSTYAKELASDPDAFFAKMDKGLELNEMMDKIQNGLQPLLAKMGGFGDVLQGALQSLMGLMPEIMGMMDSLTGVNGQMKTMLAGITGGGAQQVVTNDPKGNAPLVSAMNEASGGKPEQTTTLADGGTPSSPNPQKPETVASINSPHTPG
ncbi:MAG: hypothetical protein CO093_10760 [Alphaproteobacteria bacterium CG_4_9_14_3_um_filter_47_13]|nr:MAG: hypothetical protein CO093_10760 [Alphaproteobacteria bacterium CG_4_9_14_3_um_filter_47_13]